MKWITLKSTNLPIVSLEIDRAIEVFNGMIVAIQVWWRGPRLMGMLRMLMRCIF